MMGAPNLMDDEFNGGFGNGGFGRGGGGAYDNFGNGRGMPFHGNIYNNNFFDRCPHIVE